jgi:hypothetical protein
LIEAAGGNGYPPAFFVSVELRFFQLKGHTLMFHDLLNRASALALRLAFVWVLLVRFVLKELQSSLAVLNQWADEKLKKSASKQK